MDPRTEKQKLIDRLEHCNEVIDHQSSTIQEMMRCKLGQGDYNNTPRCECPKCQKPSNLESYLEDLEALRKSAQALIREALENPELISYTAAKEAFEIAKFINSLDEVRIKAEGEKLRRHMVCNNFKSFS